MADAICDRCSGAMTYSGRISMPPQTIYRCDSCGNQKWTAEVPRYLATPAAEQPQAQQQQQPQPGSEKKTPGPEPK